MYDSEASSKTESLKILNSQINVVPDIVRQRIRKAVSVYRNEYIGHNTQGKQKPLCNNTCNVEKNFHSARKKGKVEENGNKVLE